MAREPTLGLQLRVYDESSDEDEPVPVAVGEPVVFAQPAPDAVVEEAEAPPSTSDGRVRCGKRIGNWQCAHLFVPEVNRFGNLQTRCGRCRATMKRSKTSEAGKARAKRSKTSEAGKAREKRYRTSEAGKARAKRSKTSDKGKACKKRYQASEKGKAAAKRKYKKWYANGGKEIMKKYRVSEAGQARDKRAKTSEAGKAREHRANTTASARIGKKISKLCRDGGIDSVSAMEATGCASTAELRTHFEATFQPWMTWDNHGAHKPGGNSGAWQIGHRLAKAFYDDGNPADIKRCWNKANLFAQDADENHALSVKMPDDAVLERLRALNLLPCAWNGIVPPAAQRAEMERLAGLPVAYR